MKNLTRTLVALLLAFLARGTCFGQGQGQVGGDTLFGITLFGNQLVSVDASTGVGRVVGSLGEAANPYGIATRNGRLYTFDQLTNSIREINKISGELTRDINIGTTGLKGEGDLTFRPADGVGFLVSALDSNNVPTNDFYMFTIDDTTNVGTSVRLGTTGVPIDGLAFDANGTLYGIGQADSTLYTINQTTGQATAVGSLGIDVKSPVAGMTFGPATSGSPNGDLYAAINDRLYRINTATGAATPVSTTVLNFNPYISSVSGLAFAEGAGTLGNVSARLNVGVDENVGIVGFIIRGTATKQIVLRGIGPSMTKVPGALADPMIALYDSQGAPIAENDDYMSTMNADEIENLGLAPGNKKESALIETLPAGTYTAILSGVNRTTGIGLLELFDVDRGNGSRLANISARGLVEPGDKSLIGGLIVSGSGDQRVVVRASGPDLASRGISNPLADPMLTVYDENGTMVTSNDNYSMDPNAAEIQSQGLQPGSNLDAATIVTVSPGNYTVVVAGADNTNGTGVALVETFNLTTQ